MMKLGICGITCNLKCTMSVQVQKQLGLKLTPPVETFVDMAVTLIQTGIAKPVPK